MDRVLLMLGAAAALGCLLVAVDRAIRDQKFGLQLVLGVAFLNHAWTLPQPVVGGFQIHLRDVLLAILVASISARVLRGWRPEGAGVAFCFLAGLVLVSTARGIPAFGLTGAVNESRVHLYLMAVVIYALSAPGGGKREEVARLWLLYAAGLMALAIMRWAIVFGGLPGLGGWYDPAYGGLRVIKSDETMVLGIAFLMLLPLLLRGEGTRRQLLQAAAFGGGVLLLQHRSVISMLLLSVAAQVIHNRRMMTAKAVYALTALAMLAAVAFVAWGDGSFTEEVETADVASSDTFVWRIDGWSVLIDDFVEEGASVAAIGQPFGSGWDRVISSGQLITVSPHNMYVELLLRTGVIGLALLAVVFTLLWTRVRGLPRPGVGLLDNSTLSVILIAFSIYMVPYRLFLETGLLLGFALSQASISPGSRRAAGASRAAHPPAEEGTLRGWIPADPALSSRIRNR